MLRFTNGSLCILAIPLLIAGCGDDTQSPNNAALIRSSSCTSDFTACGGDPAGTWKPAELCVDGDLTAECNASMSEFSSDCSHACTSASLAMSGSITYEPGGNFTSNGITQLEQRYSVTAACYAAAGDGSSLSPTSCEKYQQSLKGTAGSASCTYESATCNCVSTKQSSVTPGTYQVTGNTIVEGSGNTIEFCVTGSTMMQRELLGGGVYAVTRFVKS